ncbi:hypothetical protein [Streptomyces sp. NPDC005374]|uniref:hypothetical protein n=1 Tax=Streptomyces sp. NPDC005374 TaxID=3364713 RepID=UPI003696F2BA
MVRIGQVTDEPQAPREGPVAIVYDHDGQSIADPGIVILGEIDSGAHAFKEYDGTFDVTIKAMEVIEAID